MSREILKQYQGLKEFETVDIPIVGSGVLNGFGREQLAQYEDSLKRALKAKQLLLQQRAESVERGGGDATQDAEARRLAREAAAYSKALREPGALAFMWDFHRRGMGALQDWRGYANGGMVGAALPMFADRISLPDVGGLAQPAAKALGTLMLSLGGQQLAVSADPGEASDFMAGVRRLQLKS
ncbi:hypothetical protein JOS77_30625 [Chromobacterium haemolyticum]|nr:hypothetical protein JOS77_30625 [Chromobacterium haemolyticum]